MRQATTKALLRAADALAAAGEVAVAGHTSPDGDALGSMLALALAAGTAGKRAVASFGGPFAVSTQYDFLDLSPLVPPGEFPEAPEVMVAVDTAAPDRLGELQGAAGRAGTLVVLDHHATNGGFGAVDVVDATAAATAELVYHLIRRLGWSITPPVASALLTGIVSDTGGFRYATTRPAVLRVAARLIAAGARPAEISQRLYEWLPFGYLSVASAVLGRARLEGSLVWSVLYTADGTAAGVGPEDLDRLIDDLRITRPAEVTALVKQTAQGWKFSLRSRGRVDVGAIAAALGGGGHHDAAGFDWEGDMEPALDAVRRGVRA
jgi:nanoRNase/pAp phosphatase (c-di-AMP/oligoRNAs hydrolase)